MKPIELRLPQDEASGFAADLSTWAKRTGIDPAPDMGDEPGATTDDDMPIMCRVYVSESFFEQFPEWWMYIEQKASHGGEADSTDRRRVCGTHEERAFSANCRA